MNIKKRRNLIERIYENVSKLENKHGEEIAWGVIGINYVLATATVMDEMNENKLHNIFSSEDHFEVKEYEKNEEDEEKVYDNEAEDVEVEYKGSIGLSTKFLIKRAKRLNDLLNELNNPKENLSWIKILSRKKEELDNILLKFEANDKVNWLNMNGFYTFYKSIIEGVSIYEELGRRVKNVMKEEYERLINSKQT